jgi:hypothetical protein
MHRNVSPIDSTSLRMRIGSRYAPFDALIPGCCYRYRTKQLIVNVTLTVSLDRKGEVNGVRKCTARQSTLTFHTLSIDTVTLSYLLGVTSQSIKVGVAANNPDLLGVPAHTREIWSGNILFIRSLTACSSTPMTLIDMQPDIVIPYPGNNDLG